MTTMIKHAKADEVLDCDVIVRELTRRDYAKACIMKTGVNHDDNGPEEFSVYRKIRGGKWGQCLGVTRLQFDYLISKGYIKIGSNFQSWIIA